MELKGKRITIRPAKWEDLPVMCRWLNDPVVMREVRAEKLKPTLEQLQEAWPSWQEPKINEYHESVICVGDRVIGGIGYLFQDLDPRTVSVDIKIGDPSLWGQGLGTEAMQLFIVYIHDELNVQVIAAQPGDWNTRGIRLFEKCGFKEIRREQWPATAVHDGGIIITMQRNRKDAP